MTFASPLQARISAGVVLIPSVTFDLVVRLEQSRFICDRGKKYKFVLAVEECVTNEIITASREHSELLTKLTGQNVSPKDVDDAFRNGSILRYQYKGFYPFAELGDLGPGETRVTVASKEDESTR